LIFPLTSQSRRSNCREKTARLGRLLRDFGRVGIAFSGGADSSFLLRAALAVLGADKVLALHARSCLQKKEEQERAATWPQRHGLTAVRLRVVELEPLQWPEFVRNPPERCYLCKQRIYQLFQAKLAEQGIAVLLDGSNVDDLELGQAGRPGLRAIAELGVRSPLADCGLSKEEIRALSCELGLDTWHQPASSCLATRIPQGMEITAARLELVAAMEQVLAEAGFFGCRARLVDEAAVCLHLQEQDMDRFWRGQIRKPLCRELKKQGAKKIFLDLDGR
jgi:uncharacterized protein